MVKNINLVITLVVILFLYSCNEEKISNKEMVGKWEVVEGELIRFKANNTFIARNLSGYYIFPNNTKYHSIILNDTGKWELKQWQGRLVVDLLFKKSSNLPKGYHTRLYISGTKGLFEEKPPWYLYAWKGEAGEEKMVYRKFTTAHK